MAMSAVGGRGHKKWYNYNIFTKHGCDHGEANATCEQTKRKPKRGEEGGGGHKKDIITN